MSYDTVIEQVKMLPEPLLASVSAFIKLLEAEQGREVTKNYTKQAKPKDKQAFFALAGKIPEKRYGSARELFNELDTEITAEL